MRVGLAVASASPIAAARILLYLIITFRAAIKNEEAFLRRVFGGENDRHRRDGASVTARRFSFARAIANREHRTVAGLLLALLLLLLNPPHTSSFCRSTRPSTIP